ncbi:MAG: LysM peptidoglycan-binding domain-containing protein [Chloroflexi bacterium]|nr:LysM peptidoglycan-binding domain-containing protein [Chloroflexota bacterium]
MNNTRYLVLLTILCLLTACNAPPLFSSAPASASADDHATYVVQADDTVSQIAARHYMTIEQLIALNIELYPQLARDPSLLQPGWRLRVPTPSAVAAARATATASGHSTNLDESVAAVVAEINSVRAQRGLPLLRADLTLTRMANDRCADMVARNYFSHYDPQTGQQPLLRYLQATKYTYHTAGENIAEVKNDAFWVPPWLTVLARYSSSELAHQFVASWLSSTEHRANILNGQYRRTGVALSATGDSRRVVATQLFSD